ncbi:uncharacterized membrane protein YcaP (DUF421 family) [Algoriphagus ratkowskyi]|uniref:DUF421 domain-containing protein n=1 Tax=Algoriphagus ratkowskyi TaxID=57028 RepID=A0A2W7QZZ2_9BACT|nr:DUF421 domain-containing protein [Algoriphagus ratkowskyi]PZX53834.1 uncharacterized membrane protein YcaP (DUF421 family) [Algoriphagus ratkowskyi]TXD76761.1 DUF421 domain-containing protein [Algoriphagus ratkowskyi]
MESKESIELFDLRRLLIGEEIPYSFLAEVFVRTTIMFFIVLFVLRLSGKRGIKQLSIFELAIIISLGSAAGDPMFYNDVALLPAILVFIIVISLYKLITYLTGRFKKVEAFVEGVPVKLIENGKIIYKSFRKESLAYDELFTQLRQKSVTHLGQVESAYLETSGDLSIFFFSDEKVILGLPILPDVYDFPCDEFFSENSYSCKHCGELKPAKVNDTESCIICEKNEWVEAWNTARIT